MTTLLTGHAPRRTRPLRIGLALSGWIALAAAHLLPDASVPRLVVVCAFLLLCPGAAATRWSGPSPWPVGGRPFAVESAFLPVVLSLCLDVLVVVPFYLGGAYGTTPVLSTLAAVTTLLALLPVPDRRRRAEPGAEPPDGRTGDAAPAGKRR
ncbi:hypothetical protein [Streptomyces sp. NPDC004830]